MLNRAVIAGNVPPELPANLVALEPLTTDRLTDAARQEVLAFLAQRPLQTVCLAGLVRDNGLESELNRGDFYACRNAQGQMEGVALIGHATLIEARTARALEAFAALAQEAGQHTSLILLEQERIAEFWSYYAKGGQEMRRVCRELLYELRCPVRVYEEVEGLRPATLEDLELVAAVHAEMAFVESGINPLDVDPQGFRERCARRIRLGRTWVLVEQGRLIFKAEIQADTPEAVYLEGVYVNPVERGQGYGLRCLSQLSRQLLERAESICLFVNELNTEAHPFYRKAGYKLRGCYDTIFLQQKDC